MFADKGQQSGLKIAPGNLWFSIFFFFFFWLTRLLKVRRLPSNWKAFNFKGICKLISMQCGHVNWPDHMTVIYMCSLMRAQHEKAGRWTMHRHVIPFWLLLLSLKHSGTHKFLQGLKAVLHLNLRLFRTETNRRSVYRGGRTSCRILTHAHSSYTFTATHLSGPKPAWMRVALYLWAAVSWPWLCEVCRTKCSPDREETLIRGGWVSPTILR